MKLCKVEGCNNSAERQKQGYKGYCNRHYKQIRKYGKIISVEKIAPESTYRFWRRPIKGWKTKSGYIYIKRPEHPLADKRGYVKRAYLVWEEKTGHLIDYPNEIIHHINGNKLDDWFENLRLLKGRKMHIKEHGGRLGGIRIVTKEMAVSELMRVYKLVKSKKLSIRKFNRLSNISKSVICRKWGWNKLKEELCIN